MRAQVVDEQRTEVIVLALAKQLPYICIAESSESSDLEFEKMVLVGVEVDGVDSFWLFESVGKDVVTRTSDGKDDIFRGDLEKACINSGIFPGECVDVLVSELLVLL